MSTSEIPRQLKKCYQCRKDKKRCERQAPWPANCVRCETALHYQCSKDLTMGEYGAWQGDNLHLRPGSSELHEPSTSNSSGTTTTNIRTNLERTLPDSVSGSMAVSSTLGASTNPLGLQTHVPTMQASHPPTRTQLSMVGTVTTLSGLDSSSTLGDRHGMTYTEGPTSTTSHESLYQPMADTWQEPSAGWPSNPIVTEISTSPARTQEEIEEEREKNAESLYEAVKKGDYNQVQKLLNNRNPDLNPMGLEPVRAKAVDIILRAIADDNNQSHSLQLGQCTALTRILQKLLEHGAIDHVIRYRFSNGRTILLELQHQDTYLGYSRKLVIDEIIERWGNSSLSGIGGLIVAVDFSGRSLLHDSCSGPFRLRFKPLLPKFLNELKTLCNTQDDAGNLPLHFVHEDMQVFNFLLTHTQNPFTTNQEQNTPLHSIVNQFSKAHDNGECQEKLLQQLRALLRSGSLQEVYNMRDKDGRTLLHLCTNLNALRELLKVPPSQPYSLTAIIDAEDNAGQTPLHYICSARGTRFYAFYPSMWFLAEHLILRGADVAKKDNFGRNALFYLLDTMDSVLHLYDYFYPLNPDIDASGKDGENFATLLRDCRMARRLATLLLEGGVEVDTEDLDGISARSLVESYWDKWMGSYVFNADRYILELGLHDDLDPVTQLGWSTADTKQGASSDTRSQTGLYYYELTCPELAQLRSQLRGPLTYFSKNEEWAEFICKIIKDDLEAIVNAIKNKSTRKRKRGSSPDSDSEGSEEWNGHTMINLD